MSVGAAAPAGGEDDGLLGIDELAAAVGLTVRTTRYYASLGLLPAPIRRGRVALYDDRHRARLELVRALQDHGFTLQAIERIVGRVPAGASVEELALQRAMLTSWSPEPPATLTRRELAARAGRALSDDDLAVLRAMGVVEPDGDGWVATAGLPVGVELLDLDLPPESLGEASEAIRRHMDALAEELTTVLHTRVLEPYRRREHAPAEAARLERTMARLRQLTLESVVHGFQRAANDVITRSLSR